jgi:hypothetical protein
LSAVAAIALLAVTAGCQRATEAAPPADVATQQPRLNVDFARAALIAMIEQQPDYQREFLGLSQLNAGKIVQMDDGSDALPEGVWQCSEKNWTFVFARPLGQAGLYSCNGVFEIVEGKWRARITRELHTH